MLSRNFSQKNKIGEFVFLSWQLGNTWKLKSKFKFQEYPSCQDRKTNSFFCFLGEVTAQQFCFEIYWPLRYRTSKSVGARRDVLKFCGRFASLAPVLTQALNNESSWICEFNFFHEICYLFWSSQNGEKFPRSQYFPTGLIRSTYCPKNTPAHWLSAYPGIICISFRRWFIVFGAFCNNVLIVIYCMVYIH